jgi:RES domain-containing protein
VRVWRLTSKRFQRFDGQGASLRGGRWNHHGTAVVYVSGSLSLAVLELFVNVEKNFVPDDLVAISADIPDNLRIERVEVAQLSSTWRSYPPPEFTKEIGSTWAATGLSVALSVPSAVIPLERNYLLNPKHKDFRLIQIGKPLPFRFDPRMWKN